MDSTIIVGGGDIASVLPKRDDLLFFASGVSNSQETQAWPYEREINLLYEQPLDAHIVYFGSLAIFYSDTVYTRHKRLMEEMIQDDFAKYTIMRLGNIAWGSNPHTLINYLKDHPEAEIRDEQRYIVDESEFLHWVKLIPKWSEIMNVTGKRMTIKEIKDAYCNPAS